MSTLNGALSNTGASPTDFTGAISGSVIETTLTATQTNVDIGGGVIAHAEVFNGEIPGPTFRLTLGQTVVVRLVNLLPYPLGIHWHGVELENYSDGTEVTQNGAAPAPIVNGAVSGGTFLYKFKVTRPGIFWYHPHHGSSINRVFRGLYGMIVVTDPAESSITGSVLPADNASESMELVLGDITVCKAPAMGATASQNDIATYPTALFAGAEWLSGGTAQGFGPAPKDLCEISPTDEMGNALAAPYSAGDVPSLMSNTPPRVEGQTVLTNGVYIGARGGTPGAPGTVSGTATKKTVMAGQGLRMRILNAATLRYFRLVLSTPAGVQVDLIRVGGEGGLLDTAWKEGGARGTVPDHIDPSTLLPIPFYSPGEVLLPPGGRADVVAVIPSGLVMGDVLTLWTRDCQRTGGGVSPQFWAEIPTVPVLHLEIGAGTASYTLVDGTPIRTSTAAAAAGMIPVIVLPAPGVSDHLLPPPGSQPGLASENIQLEVAAPTTNFDGYPGMALMMDPTTMMPYMQYTDAPHIGSTRYGRSGSTLELTITNTTNAHHPFHLHGFSFQPKNIKPQAGGAALYTWARNEYRDTVDLMPHTMLTIRVNLDNTRVLADGVTTGGEYGRWFFHCHIFFHHMHGMISELVVTDAAGAEKPNVNVGGSFEYKQVGMMATRHGTFHHPGAGVNVTSLTATTGTVTPTPPLPAHEGTWDWNYTPTGSDPQYIYVYIQAGDAAGRKDQAVFRLQTSGPDTSSDTGDPHIRTVHGPKYDFQAAGEFTLLRDGQGMEIQVRQTPASTPPPVKDDYTGLTECVSLNSAVAARVGPHRICYLPWRNQVLTFFRDGKPVSLKDGMEGMELGAHRLSTFAAGTEIGIRIDYAHGPVVTITPNLWTSYGIHYFDVEVSNTDAEGGLMGRIPNGSWLPALPSGATLGPQPVNLDERYIQLYRTFADAWRLTDATTLFEYLPGRSTEWFTDRNWPPPKPPCVELPRTAPQPVHRIREGIPLARAKLICKEVTLPDLHVACVFDVATTGDENFAKAYEAAQGRRLKKTAVQVVGDRPQTRPGQKLCITATVVALTPKRPVPTGTVIFIVDGVRAKKPTRLDECGRAYLELKNLKPGEHKIRATYSGGGECEYDPSSSPTWLHTVAKPMRPPPKRPPPKRSPTKKSGKSGGMNMNMSRRGK